MTEGQSADSDVAAIEQPLESVDCGYTVTADVNDVSELGYKLKLAITNVSGPTGQNFSVFVDVGDARIVEASHGTAEAVEGGYLIKPLASLAESELNVGQTYRFELAVEGASDGLAAYVITANGTNCDPSLPELTFGINDDFFTANGTLTLTASATDNVAVHKIVFEQDGAVIGEALAASYTLDVPVTAVLDGRHRFTATAYDVTGNVASQTERVLVAIDNQFFGTAASSSADYPGLLTYFDQVTPGNAGKWGSVEANQDQMNWAELDTAYNFAKSNGIPFKLHTLVWGSQQPAWIDGLSAADQLAEIDEWMAALAARYPDVEMIDVVNEPLHAPPSYIEALGGKGVTGWDWMIKAFEMARRHFPNSELILNEYNVVIFPPFTSDLLPLVNLLNERGLIDGIGEQGHFLERAELSVVADNLNRLAATGLPLYISELDIDFADDARQAVRMSELFPIFWEHPSVVGVTHWGYRQGTMWRESAHLLRSDGTERPALTWLECYLAGNTACSVPAYVPQPRTGDAGSLTLQAEDYDTAQGVIALGSIVAYTDNGDWLGYDKVAFNASWDSLSVTYAKGNLDPASVSIHLDSIDSAPIAEVSLPGTGGWGTSKTVSIPWVALSGERAVFVRFNGGYGIANLDSLRFSAPTRNIVANGTFESGTSGWFTWNSGELSATTARAHGGTQSLRVSNRASNAPAATNLTGLVKRGGSYPVSLWVSIDSLDGSSKSINVTRKIVCAGSTESPYAWLINPVVVPGDASWVELKGTLSIPDCDITEVQLWAEGGAGVDLYVDDVQVLDSSAANLLTDGTFESGMGGWFSWNDSSLAVTSTFAHSGSYSLLSANRTANGVMARNVTSLVSPGKVYLAEFWVAVTGVTVATPSVNVTRKITCNGTTSYNWLGVATVTNGEWSKISGTVDLSACTTVGEVTLYAEGPTSGNLYLDDVSLSLQ